MFGNQNTQPYSPPRPLGQDYRRSATNQQARALPLIYGRQRVGCEFISDVFDILTSDVSSGGKSHTKLGTNYYASFAVAVCHGPVNALHDLYLNGDPIFTQDTKLFEVSLTLTNNVATYQTANPHGLTTGNTVVVYNCQQAEFNGEFLITVVSPTQFQYTIPGPTIASDTATPVDGTEIYCYVKLDPIYANGQDATDFTIPDFGTATIYWGTQTQPVDAYMAGASGVQHPPYLGICYIVFRQLYLGFNQTNIQNIECVVERTPAFAGMGTPAHAVINGDCNPACIAADLCLSVVYGLACDPNDDFNAASFNAAAEQFYGEGIAFSPVLDRPNEALSTHNDILSMVDAAIVVDANGLLAIAMQRQGTIAAVNVQDANLVEFATFTPQAWSEVINQTYLNFLDRDSGWQPDFILWADNAGIYAKDRPDAQTLDKQFITNRALATQLCAIAGQVSALPKNDGKLSIAFDAGLFASLTPGNGFTFTYAHRADQSGIYRVMSRSIEDPAKPVFVVEVSVDRSYLYTTMAGEYISSEEPPPEDSPIPDLVEFVPFGNFQIVELPAALCPDSQPAIAALVARTSPSMTIAALLLGRNYTFTGVPPESFELLQTLSKFALHGVLTADFLAAAAVTAPDNALPAESADWPDPLPLTAGLQIQLDGPDLILPDVSDFDSLAGGVLLFVGNEIMAIGEQQMTAAGAYTLTVIRGAFGTTIADQHAGDVAFIIPRSSLVPIQHPHFLAANTAEFKLTLGQQSITDVVAFDLTFTGANWHFSS